MCTWVCVCVTERHTQTQRERGDESDLLGSGRILWHDREDLVGELRVLAAALHADAAHPLISGREQDGLVEGACVVCV